MDLLLQGKRALVVGASMGIGAAVAEGLAREGSDVAIVARRSDVLQQLARSIGESTKRTVLPLVADVADRTAGARVVDDAAHSLSGLDIVVNCLSAPVFGRFLEHTDEDWELAMHAKFHSYVRTIRAAIPHFQQAGAGVVVNVIGKGGRTYVKDHLAGGASNAALMLLTVGLATELGPHKIRVVGVNPGAVKTPRFDHLVEQIATSSGMEKAAVERDFVAKIPTGGVPLVTEIADVVVFLASDRARQVNGTVVAVDGGSSGSI